MNEAVSLYRYVKTERGWRRVAVHPVRKGRGWIEAPYGAVELGQYQVRWYEGSRTHFASVGRDLQVAINQQEQKELELKAKNAADKAGIELVPEDSEALTLPEQAKKFVKEKEAGDLDEGTPVAYRNQIAEFLRVTGKRYARQINKQDLQMYLKALRERGLRPTSVWNNYHAIATFLKFCGIDHKLLLDEKSRPQKDNGGTPESYSPEEVAAFMAALGKERYQLMFLTLLRSGMREREMSHLEWRDIDFIKGVLTVHDDKTIPIAGKDGKPAEVRFRSKTRKSRQIPLESGLAVKLKAWKKKQSSGRRLVFGRDHTDAPDNHLIIVCKDTSRNAGLVCGQCDTCLRTATKKWPGGRKCEHWYLHKFRATFATMSLKAGVDLRTVSAWLGHAKLEMTAKYLTPATGQEAQNKINSVFAAS